MKRMQVAASRILFIVVGILESMNTDAIVCSPDSTAGKTG
jgi:hypothetical protein